MAACSHLIGLGDSSPIQGEGQVDKEGRRWKRNKNMDITRYYGRYYLKVGLLLITQSAIRMNIRYRYAGKVLLLIF